MQVTDDSGHATVLSPAVAAAHTTTTTTYMPVAVLPLLVLALATVLLCVSRRCRAQAVSQTSTRLLLPLQLFLRCLGLGGGGGARRSGVLLVGIASSGKTALFSRLVCGDRVADTRTSMQANVGTLHTRYFATASAAANGNKDTHNSCDSGMRTVTITDYPGHRRLRDGLYAHVATAADVVLVVDAVTIHDDRDTGAAAVAELLVSLLQSRCFAGVRRLCVACTRRDVVTSYSAKAVRVLLERAVTQVLAARGRELAAVDAVRDASGNVIAARAQARTSGKDTKGGDNGDTAQARALRLRDDGVFTFDQLAPLSVCFVDISSFAAADDDSDNAQSKSSCDATATTTSGTHPHPYSVAPLVDFVLQRSAPHAR